MKSFLISCSLILITLLGRMLPHAVPTPIVALALFAAITLPQKELAFVIFFGGLFVSDLVTGLHSFIPVVYASLVPALWLGFRCEKNPSWRKVSGTVLLGSAIYFILTNFGVWVLGGCDWTQPRQYPLTLDGLISAYSAALPGLPKKIFLDLIGSALLFAAVPRIGNVSVRLHSFARFGLTRALKDTPAM